MNEAEASALIEQIDEADHVGRRERLVELTDLLPDGGLIGFSGQAAEWLFEDVKGTWLYGCFASTVVTAHAFCALQLAGLIRMLEDNPDLPDEARSLEELATFAHGGGVIDVERQARLLELHDRFRSYSSMQLHEHTLRLERHLIESERVGGDDPLLEDARRSVEISVQLLYLRDS